MTVDKIVSGGQTGVDRAALDTAIRLGIPHGGWCPHGRRAEDGRLDKRYLLTETPGDDYLQRTEWNVRDSDATLILTCGPVEGGTAATRDYCRHWNKPLQLVDLSDSPEAEITRQWLTDNAVRVINIAGPRASKQSKSYELAMHYLEQVFTP